EAELYFCITSLHLGSRDLGQYIVDALVDMKFTFEEVRKIEKAEAAQAAIVAAAAEALSHAERVSEMARASRGELAGNMQAIPAPDGQFGDRGPGLFARSPSPGRPLLPAPRTSLFFQKHDPVLRTALARSAMAMAQEKYWSGIDDIAFDLLPPGSPRPKNTVAGSGSSSDLVASPSSLPSAEAKTESAGKVTRTGRPRSDSGSQLRNFMAILMGEDGMLSRLRPRRGSSNLSAKPTTSPPSSP
ncbi:hypothetical protein BGZ82_002899, partial [Podila clonocystis]